MSILTSYLLVMADNNNLSVPNTVDSPGISKSPIEKRTAFWEKKLTKVNGSIDKNCKKKKRESILDLKGRKIVTKALGKTTNADLAENAEDNDSSGSAETDQSKHDIIN